MATLTGGVAVEAPQAFEVLDQLDKTERVTGERYDQRLWDTWPLMLAIMLIVCAEWIIRKLAGLA